jgi:opacity protein-like surface antigen
MNMRLPLLLLVTASAAFSQPFSVGIKAGVPLTDFVSAVKSQNLGFNSATRRYIVGATAELRLPAGFAVEFDALYRRLNYDGSSILVDVFQTTQTTGNVWEFPLLLKYRFHTRVARPYLDAGVAFDTLTGLKQTIVNTVIPQRLTTTTTSGTPQELKNKTSPGFVIGAGIDIHALFLHISPEVRYTRWGQEHFSSLNGLLRSNQNQGEFLLGITF